MVPKYIYRLPSSLGLSCFYSSVDVYKMEGDLRVAKMDTTFMYTLNLRGSFIPYTLDHIREHVLSFIAMKLLMMLMNINF